MLLTLLLTTLLPANPKFNLGVRQPDQFHATNTPKYLLKIVLANQLVPTPPHVHENILHTQNYAYEKAVVPTPSMRMRINSATVTRRKCTIEIGAYKSQ
jgi:hypothetical protein